MSDIFLRLVAFVPERTRVHVAKFAGDPKSVRNWITHLPLTNADLCARQLLDALRDMNKQRLEPAARLESLELLRAPLTQLQSVLDVRARGDSFPLPSVKRQSMDVAQDLQHEMSVAYVVALYDFCAPAGDVPFMKGKSVALAGARALQHIGMQLARAYLLYLAPAPGVWRMLHRVFLFLDEAGQTERMLDDPLPGGGQLNARHAYLQCLLLALNNPYRLTQKENIVAFQLARAWAPHCSLERDATIPGGLGVDMNGDNGPGYLEQERSRPEAHEWSFHYDELEKRLHAEIGKLPPNISTLSYHIKGAPDFNVDVTLVRSMMHAWYDARMRVHQRLAAGYKLDSILGLHAAHFVLAGNRGFESFLQTMAETSISLTDREDAAPWVNSATDNPAIRRLHATVLDQSLGGYRVIWPAAENLRARIGELVILAPAALADEAQDWMVGVMRWLRIHADSSVEAGIELLARRAKPASLRSYDDERHLRPPMRALLLDSLGEDSLPATVLTPPLLERHLERVELTVPRDIYDEKPEAHVEVITDLDVINDTGTYLRFAWNPPASPDGPDAPDPAELSAAGLDELSSVA